MKRPRTRLVADFGSDLKSCTGRSPGAVRCIFMYLQRAPTTVGLASA